jgi:enoyl-CoA hydratase
MTNDVDLGSRFLRWEQRGTTAWVTIDRPERRNALTSNMYFGIRRAVDRVNASRSLHALVVTGTDNVFAPGGELGGQHDDGDINIGELLGTGAVPFDAIRDSRKPVIAAVNGLCMGGGLLITMLSDVAIASERSSARPSCDEGSPTRTTPRSWPSTSGSRSRETCCSPGAASLRTKPNGTASSRSSCRTSSWYRPPTRS